MPKPGVMYSIVIENNEKPKGENIKDFISFYNLPSRILKTKSIEHDHKIINVSFNNLSI